MPAPHNNQGLATLNVTTANSSGTSPVIVETKRSLGARLYLQTARVAEIPTQQMAGPSNDEHIRALQGMDLEAMKAYFADLKG